MTRIRNVGSRVLRVLDWFTPTVREAWTFGLAALIPLVLLAGARLWAVGEVDKAAGGWDRLYVQLGELEFWGVWFAAYALLARIPSVWWRRFARTLMHVLTVPLLVGSLAEMGFFVVTGGRADLDTVLFGIDQFEQAWPVVASELKPWDYALVAGVVLLSLVPLAVRTRSNHRSWGSRLFLLLLIPAIYNETQGRPRPRKALRPLQKTLAEALFWEAMDRRLDVFTPPDPADIAPVRTGAPGRPFNVVVIFLESVGYNRTTLGNPGLRTTPNLAHLAERGLQVQMMTSAVTHTTKALLTTLCGDWPNLVGDAREASPGGLPRRCLAELLREQGYRTAFFQTARADFEDRNGLVHGMGYTSMFARDALAAPVWQANNYFGIDDRAMLSPGLEWSAQDPDRPFLATYLTLASHHDYKVPTHAALFDFPDVTGRLEKYLNAVRYVDDFVGRLVRGYEERGLAENTLFVVIGDHGEGFGEHGVYQHDLTIYEEGLHVPMVMMGAGALEGRTGTIAGNRQQIDVLPTILDVLDMPVKAGTLRGATLLEPAPEGRVLFHSCWRSHRCLARREGEVVYLDHYGDKPAQVFNVADDPGQKKDLAKTIPKEQLAAWQAETRAWYGQVRGRYVATQEAWLQTIQRPDDSPAIATWEGSLSLLGCDVANPEVLPEENAWVKCRWRAEKPITSAWTLLATISVKSRSDETEWTPLGGAAKMFTWSPGWSIDDAFRVAMPAHSRAGEGMISVAWERLGGGLVPTDDGRERVDVAPIMLLPPFAPSKARVEGILLDDPPVWGEEWELPLLPVGAASEGEGEGGGDLDEETPVHDDRPAPTADGTSVP